MEMGATAIRALLSTRLRRKKRAPIDSAFARSDLTLAWSSDYNSLLELAEACDVPVRWSCGSGVCRTCESTLIAGDLDYSPDPLEPPTAAAHSSAAHNRGTNVVLDL